MLEMLKIVSAFMAMLHLDSVNMTMHRNLYDVKTCFQLHRRQALQELGKVGQSQAPLPPSPRSYGESVRVRGGTAVAELWRINRMPSHAKAGTYHHGDL